VDRGGVLRGEKKEKNREIPGPNARFSTGKGEGLNFYLLREERERKGTFRGRNPFPLLPPFEGPLTKKKKKERGKKRSLLSSIKSQGRSPS